MNFPESISEEELQLLTKELQVSGWTVGWGSEVVWAYDDDWEKQARYAKLVTYDDDEEVWYRLQYHPDKGWVDGIP